jgi:hypothetical protein
MNWNLFYELNKEFINLHIVVGLVMIVLILFSSYFVQTVRYIQQYVEEFYGDRL